MFYCVISNIMITFAMSKLVLHRLVKMITKIDVVRFLAISYFFTIHMMWSLYNDVHTLLFYNF